MVFLHIMVKLFSIDTRMIVKDRNKNVDKHYSKEALEQHKRTDVKNFNKDSSNTKKISSNKT